jgi:beta-phosphoglucomutase-like phosphatase (HAD superfamily)
MSCASQCYVPGGPWIEFDPNCPIHGYEAQRADEIREQERQEQEEREAEQEARLEALEETIEQLKAFLPKWMKVSEFPPTPGMIVKKFKDGSVWAGYYSGSEKESSFVEYIRLPE